MDDPMYSHNAYVGPPLLFEHPGKRMCHDDSLGILEIPVIIVCISITEFRSTWTILLGRLSSVI